jgi:hypothetical protein
MTHTQDTPSTDGTRWRGFSHKDLYVMLHDGPGAAASAEPSRRWAEISSTLTEVGQDLRKALDQTGSGWSGPAAGAAYDRLSTTVVWADETGASAGAMRTSVEDQANHIAKARADMPKPEDVPAAQPDPTVAPVVQVIQAQTDAEPAEATASSAEERAIEVMAAYEQNTNTTTAALALFDTPKELLPSHGMHHGTGGGLLGLVSGAVGGLLGGGRPHNENHHDRGHDNRNWHSPQTSGSSATVEEGRRPHSAPPPGPGKITGVATEPLLAPGGNVGRQQDRSSNRGSGSGSGSGSSPGAGARTGAGNMGVPTNELQQAAAASQAANTAHAGAGAPIAPTSGGMGGGQDKVGLRRFGMDAIGSSQWFGDTEEPVVGQSPKRRFDLRDSTDVPESVAILDEESQLPPNVIGDGSR